MLGNGCAGPFKGFGIVYEPSEQTKSEIYQSVLPLINSGKVELLDHARLETQFVGLERRTAQEWSDSIDHAPKAHDDLVNACCGALLQGRLEVAVNVGAVGRWPVGRGFGSIFPPGADVKEQILCTEFMNVTHLSIPATNPKPTPSAMKVPGSVRTLGKKVLGGDDGEPVGKPADNTRRSGSSRAKLRAGNCHFGARRWI